MTVTDAGSTAQPGAYGLRIDGLNLPARWTASVGLANPVLAIEVAVGGAGGPPAQSWLDGDHAELRLTDGGGLRMARGARQASFWFAHAPTPDELLHPWLAPAAAVTQLWAGREAFHGGAFMSGAGGVLVLAAKEGGKSTTLAVLAAEHRRDIVTDDLIIVVDGAVAAGPRCLDLRAGGPGHGLDLRAARAVRRGDRLRVELPPAPADAPVAGVAVLSWGPRLELERVAPARRLATLLPHRMFAGRLPGDPAAALALAALPMVTVTRPRGDGGLGDAARAIADYFG